MCFRHLQNIDPNETYEDYRRKVYGITKKPIVALLAWREYNTLSLQQRWKDNVHMQKTLNFCLGTNHSDTVSTYTILDIPVTTSHFLQSFCLSVTFTRLIRSIRIFTNACRKLQEITLLKSNVYSYLDLGEVLSSMTHVGAKLPELTQNCTSFSMICKVQ